MRLSGQLVTALALLLTATTLPADDLGRLFSTPTERARIDDIRAGNHTVVETSDAETVDRMVLNGTLAGSNGKRLAWVNGVSVEPDAPGSNVTLLYDGRARLQWRGGLSIRTVKPGQGVDKATGEVFELYDRLPSTPASAVNPSTETVEAEVN